MKSSISLLLGFSLGCVTAQADWEKHFEFEKITTPAGMDSQVGAMDFSADGKLAVAFHRGELMLHDPADGSWTMFASGLQEPLGMLCEADGAILVMQRCELTRLRDTNGDGRADRYETVYDGFGMSGNYHEFSYGPARDADGNLYVILGVASNGAPMREEIRGEFSEIGKMNREQMASYADWKKNSGPAGRMYSRVPYRGWVMKVSPDGSKVEPYASGFRSPDGIGFDQAGRLLVTDNQGDWRPSSPLYDVKRGGFYGHPASLVWKRGWDGRDPMDLPVEELDQMQTQPAGFFPQGELANSPTQPLPAHEKFLPPALAGQTLIGEMNQPTLVRVLDDEVNGRFQAALVHFLDGSPLGKGNHRLAFSPDGTLYVGKTALSWAGDTGIKRVKWKGTPFFAIEKIKALHNGFAVRFSEAVDESTLPGIVAKRHGYHYFATYGSPKVDEQELPVESTELLADGKTLIVRTGTLKSRQVHLLDFTKLKSKSGESPLGAKAWYHVVEVPAAQ